MVRFLPGTRTGKGYAWKNITPGIALLMLHPRIATTARGARLTPEREASMLVGSSLLPREKLLLRELLFRREGALAWSWEHMSRIREEVMPAQRIKTVPHEGWQHPGFKIPRALGPVINEMLRDRLQRSFAFAGWDPTRSSP